VAVQTGEGTENIIYGTTSVPAGPRTLGGYLARPDGRWEWPTVLVYGPASVPTGAIKNICRVLARHGIAALAPDLTGDVDRDLRVSESMAQFVTNPAGDWSNAEYGFGVLAFEGGLPDAAALAAVEGRVLAVASVAADLDESITDQLESADIAGLFIGSRGDETTDIEASLEQRDRLPQTTFVIYPKGDTGFWNDDADGFDVELFDDTLDRVISFMAGQLPPRV
jgi:dienelactone hydrolase